MKLSGWTDRLYFEGVMMLTMLPSTNNTEDIKLPLAADKC